MSDTPKSEFPYAPEQVMIFVMEKIVSDEATFKALKTRAADLCDKELNFFVNMTGDNLMKFLALVYPQLFEEANAKQIALVFSAQAMAKVLYTDMVSEFEGVKGPVQ